MSCHEHMRLSCFEGREEGERSEAVIPNLARELPATVNERLVLQLLIKISRLF